MDSKMDIPTDMADLVAALSPFSRVAASGKDVSLWDLLIILFTSYGILSWLSPWYHTRKRKQSLDFFFYVPQEKEVSKGRHVGSRNIVERMRDVNADIVIFWGSEGGTAERFANRLAGELEGRFGIRVLAADLSQYDHKHLVTFDEAKIAGFILSTYGEGDPPTNTESFWRTLAGLVDNKVRMPTLRYFLFGLGNRNYRHYNRVAEVVDTSLQAIGARRVGPVGRADDSNGGTEEDFLSWKRGIMDYLQETLNLKELSQSYRPSIAVQEISSGPAAEEDDQCFLGEPHPSLMAQKRSSLRYRSDLNVPSIFPVRDARILSVSENRACLHIEFSLEAVPWIRYQTGDHLAIWPVNPESEVNRLLNVLGLREKSHVKVSIGSQDHTLSSQSGKLTLPPLTTIDALFRYYLEICAPLSRDLMAGLAEFAPGAAEKERLSRLADDRAAFEGEVLRRHRTLAAVLQSIGGEKTWEIPLSYLIERLRRMQPRRYSISSSALTQPRSPSITAVVDTTSHRDQSYESEGCGYGVTTSYLLALQNQWTMSSGRTGSPRTDCDSAMDDNGIFAPAGARSHTLSGPRNLLDGVKIFGQIRRSGFKLPPKPSTLVILIGAGTGIAPLRGFVQERARQKEIGLDVGKTLLILGFRKSDEDFLYRDEWYRLQQVLGQDRLKVWTAFSREDPTRKVYVHDRLWDHADEILQVLEDDDRSAIYICGSAKMAGDAVSELKRIWACKGHLPEGKADTWLTALRRSARLHEDVWG